MAAITDELVSICSTLPEAKARELVDFARFLQQQAGNQTPGNGEDGEAAWERILNDPRPRPKLRAYVEKVLKEEPFEPLDESRL